MNSILRYSGVFVVLVLLQLLIFNNIQFSGYINPYVYVLLFIILPLSMPSWVVLIIAFLAGFIIDAFSGTMGVHTFASVMAGFVRPWIISLNMTHEAADPESSPSVQNNGLRWFFLFALMIVLVHHLSLFYVEVFSFAGFFRTLLRVIVSTLFTTFFIVIIDMIGWRR
ncbi:MAG TPA: rod shape-determining protein MreD [Bacteroidales bacterium]|nr:rod shape-determining protein MreD [Bacteroidales bacterium]